MGVRIALAGNPNSGKTTLFNALTGSNQFVGNWPGVTVEKKEGKLKKHDGVVVTDLPGIYSLSPYTLEEVVARNYLIEERPDAILNIIDGTNLERNLYLTTQLVELGIPVVVAVNMCDLVKKNGDEINFQELSRELGCRVVEISALKGIGVMDAAEAAIEAAEKDKTIPQHTFSGPVEHAIAHIEEAVVHNMPEEQQRWYAIKIFERDEKVMEYLKIDADTLAHVEQDIVAAETELDDDAESIITNERYVYIAELINGCYKKNRVGQLTTSDKIDQIVTNRWLGLPIFAAVMFFVYWIAMVGVGASATDWANDGLFGDGWHLFGNGTKAYEADAEEFGDAFNVVDAFVGVGDYTNEDGSVDMDGVRAAAAAVPAGAQAQYTLEDEETLATEDVTYTAEELSGAMEVYEKYEGEAPDPAAYGTWVPGVPVVIEGILDKLGVAGVLKSLILDGIVAGVGAVLGFVPQMLVLFLMLAFLEACGYMARIAFVLDRIFRKFGLSGKSFIPMLVGTGCGIPGVAIIISGIMLKKTAMFAGDPAPFVMELPAYHMPTPVNVLRSMWERGWSFIKKAGSIILLSTIVIWFLSNFGFVDGAFGMLEEDQLNMSILAGVGSAISWIFAPLGWGNWQAAVASITGLVAKENIVGTMGVLYRSGEGTVYQTLAGAFTPVTAYSFLVFNLLCAPCFAAIGAIRREMNNMKWTWFAIGYQCGFAYVIALMINQFGGLATGHVNPVGLIAAVICLAGIVYMLFFKKYTEAVKLTTAVKVS